MHEVIKSKDNKIIKHVSKLMSFSKYRRDCSEFVVEGVRLCLDAVTSKAEISLFIYTKKAKIKYAEQFKKIFTSVKDFRMVSDDVMSYLSDTNSPQGMLCICRMKENYVRFDKIGKFIALENIQDPSNMGTILRTAEAIGVNGVIISQNSCDIYNPKSLRGSMGAVFRIPVLVVENMSEEIIKLNDEGFTTYAAVPDKNAININKTSFKDASVIVLGNEGNGLAKETMSSCMYLITIPMLGRAESLNVATAASIMMWEMVRGE